MAGVRTFEIATRVGFAARGLIYVLIGWLALRSGRAEDGSGILDYLAGGGGWLLLAVMAAGLFAYGLWRLLDAWLDLEGRGSDGKAAARRAGAAVSGLAHLGLGAAAALHALGSAGRGGGSQAESGAETALALPGGGIILILAAAALFATGLVQLGKAWSLSFMRPLGGGGEARRWLCLLGRAGFAARGTVFLIIAWFFWRAGREASSAQAGGVAEALRALPSSLQMVVAAGLLLFGLFSFAEAWFRRIPDAHVGQRLGNLAG